MCVHQQVRSTGGPSPQAATSFSVANRTVATVSTVGLVEAWELGSTNVTGVVQAADPIKGQTLMYSKVIFFPAAVCLISEFTIQAFRVRLNFRVFTGAS